MLLRSLNIVFKSTFKFYWITFKNIHELLKHYSDHCVNIWGRGMYMYFLLWNTGFFWNTEKKETKNSSDYDISIQSQSISA